MCTVQLLKSERNLSQYTIGRGNTSLVTRLSTRKRANSAPPGGLAPLQESAPAKLNDWRQRFVEVLPSQLSCNACSERCCLICLEMKSETRFRSLACKAPSPDSCMCQ